MYSPLCYNARLGNVRLQIMHLNLEKPDKHAIQSYGISEIKINDIVYKQSIVVCRQQILTEWPIKSISELNLEGIDLLVAQKPEIIIIGHQDSGKFAPASIREFLGQKHIGFECMSIGAACRTYNVLLDELREVVLGIIL